MIKKKSMIVKLIILILMIIFSKWIIIRIENNFDNKIDSCAATKGIFLLAVIITIICSVVYLCSFYTSKEKEFLSTFCISRAKNMHILFSKVKYINIFSSILFLNLLYEYITILKLNYLEMTICSLLFFIDLYLIEITISIIWDRFPFKDIGFFIITLFFLFIFQKLIVTFASYIFNENIKNNIILMFNYLGNLELYNFLFSILLDLKLYTCITLLTFLLCYFISYKNTVSINKTLFRFRLPQFNNKRLFYTKSLNGFLIKDLILLRQMKITLFQAIICCPIALYNIPSKISCKIIFIECIVILIFNCISSTYIFSMEENYLYMLKSLPINEKNLVKYKFISMYVFSSIVPILILIFSLINGNLTVNVFCEYFIIILLLSLIYSLSTACLCYMFFMRIQKSVLFAILTLISFIIPPLAIIFIIISIKNIKKLEDIEV